MSANPRDNYKAKRGRKNKGPPFLQLYYHVLDSAAWHALSPVARVAYIEIARTYDGLNNGRLAMSVRRLAETMPCAKNTANKAITELEDAGFIAVMKFGTYTRKNRLSSEYRLTCYRCDVTGEPATKGFQPSKKWAPSLSQKLRQNGLKNWDSTGSKIGTAAAKNGHLSQKLGP